MSGGERTLVEGFPRAGTSAEQKAEFHDALLLLTPPEPSPGGGKVTKMDLRRFKRALKAFCGGKKVLNKAW